MEIRIKARDGTARLAEYKLRSGRKITLPTFFPVYNPHIPLITPREMRELGVETLITNAYIIWRDRRLASIAEEKGIHRLLDFDGVVMTDSGAYQVWMYGDIEVTNEEIVEFQTRIGVDIGTFLDFIVPYGASREEAEEGVRRTVEAARIAREVGGENVTWMGTAQGSTYTDLVRENARRIAELGFEYFAVGALKVATTSWIFSPQVDYVLAALDAFPRNRPVHLWGLGHPATFALFVLMGVDSFDSAAYALYARAGRYMTPSGTLLLSELEEFPCECPVCSKYSPEELRKMEKEKREKLLALHNLHVTIAEMKRIREALRGEYLFEYVQERVRAHPSLLEAYIHLLKNHGDWLLEFTPFPKSSGFFWSGEESKHRPEVVRAKRLLERVKMGRSFKKEPFGEVPFGLKYTYPFGQSHVPFQVEPEEEPAPEDVVRAVITYQFGVDIGDVEVEVRRGRARKVYQGGTYIGMIRPSDGFFVPSMEGARRLAKRIRGMGHKIVVAEEAVGPVSEGRSVFAKFVLEADPDLHPNEEVIVLSPSGEVIATGKAVLSARELKEFRHHVAVKVRHHLRSSKGRGDPQGQA